MSYRVLADASLPELNVAFPAPFELHTYDSLESLEAALPFHDILVCRSTLKITPELLQSHPIKWILTASSGRDHIDESFLQANDIQLLDAKGSNANAVGDYVLATLAYLKLVGTLGIVGYGAVGSRLYQRLTTLGFKVFTYDPMHPGPNHRELADLIACDALCIHANLHATPPYPSVNLIDATFLKQCSKDYIIINAARGGIVDEKALLQHYAGIYCTDVFSNEPEINPEIVQRATVCTPHIAGHTVEAKIDAVRQLSLQLHERLGLSKPVFPPHATYQRVDEVLEKYNPIIETHALKANPGAFVSIRQAHVRHGFEWWAR